MGEYTRPGRAGSMDKDKPPLKQADSILWGLMCDIEYYLDETNSRDIVPTKHALDMMLKHIHRTCHDIYERIHSTMPDVDALDTIQEFMSGNLWSAETLDDIADAVRETGREIKDDD